MFEAIYREHLSDMKCTVHDLKVMSSIPGLGWSNFNYLSASPGWNCDNTQERSTLPFLLGQVNSLLGKLYSIQ